MKQPHIKENIIEGLHINKSFHIETGEVDILKDNTFNVEKGSFTIVFGPSGSGKSTLLNIILGLENPSAGDLKFLGIDIYKNLTVDGRTDLRKHRVGIITQQQNWIKSLNVVENVAFPLALQGIEYHERLSAAVKLLELVDMTDRASFMPTQLSGGEQQKVALARCLVNDPEIIIADEPTGNLDIRSGDELIAIMLKLVEQGKTIVMVTHNIDYIEYADTILHVVEGKIVNIHQVTQLNLKKLKSDLLLRSDEYIDGNRKNVNKQKVEKEPDACNTRKFSFKCLRHKLATFFNRDRLKDILAYIWLILPFMAMRSLVALIFYTLDSILQLFIMARFIPNVIKATIINWMMRILVKLEDIVEGKDSDRIRTFDLVELSIRTMFAKKARTLITVGGMGIGIGIIVFMLSVGFGLERLVIKEAIKANELNQIDAVPAINGNTYIDNNFIEDVSRISGVNKVLPQANFAGKVNYQGSNSDVIVYSVGKDYLIDSSINLTKGDVFNEIKPEDKTKIREAVVNTGFLGLLGVTQDEIGLEFSIEFIVSKDLISKSEEDLVSEKQAYKIVGVTDTGTAPFIYIPLKNTEEFGIDHYSQLRIMTNSEGDVSSIRSKAEVLGLSTTSARDTMDQIEGIFKIVRQVLFVIGIAALAIASLGMINTLTISLLERTKEVSLMKTIGMKSREVEELFVTESLIMGVLGGFLGLIIGVAAGKLVSLVITLWAVGSGYDAIDISYLPLGFVLFILLLAAFVGNLTGIYPAKRAKEISPIDALRYE